MRASALHLRAIVVTLRFRQGLWSAVQGWIGSSLFPTERVLVSGTTPAPARREAEVAAPLAATR